MPAFLRSLFAACLAITAAASYGQDVARGQALYETHCGECHYQRVHQRRQPAVKDLAGLRDMIARWAPLTRHRFTLDEREDVAAYLNQSHYRFGLPARQAK